MHEKTVKQKQQFTQLRKTKNLQTLKNENNKNDVGGLFMLFESLLLLIQ